MVCRELGYGYGQHAIQTDFFGGNRTQIALSGVQCQGTERSLADCFHDRFGKVNCPGKKDNIAAVVCATGNSFLFCPNISVFWGGTVRPPADVSVLR